MSFIWQFLTIFGSFFTDGQYNSIKGHFSPNDVHHQLGIAFTTPVFPDQSISESVETQMFLHKPSDGCESPPVTFYFTPKEFAVPTKKLQAKRTKAAIKLEEQNDSELSERKFWVHRFKI